ncbi:MAG TPA: hypothetical protein VEA69_04215 [Tepidisphaeraceae bacterium]|nr:hypothetical protein [Tepidisphaeraceae bacterium]
MLRVVRWTLLTAFVASVVTAVGVRQSGYTRASLEDGRYYASYRSTRDEVSAEEYERIWWRDRITQGAVFTMTLSLIAFAGLESVRFGGSRVRRRRGSKQSHYRG